MKLRLTKERFRQIEVALGRAKVERIAAAAHAEIRGTLLKSTKIAVAIL